jgi:type VI secretion system protein ImpE
MNPGDDLLRSGDLDGARTALIETVKRAPSDASARMFLWQLMALSGEWDKAVVQLRALAQISAEAQMLAAVYSQALEAEKTRLAAYAGQGEFPVLVASSPWIESLSESLAAEARGEADRAGSLREAAFEAAGDTPGIVGDQKFGWIADIDPRLGPAFEAIVSGRWGLIPFEAVVSIKTEGPRDLRDLVWLPVEIALRSGQSAAALLPARYPGSEAAEASVRLGHETRWVESGGLEAPLGQKVWSTDTDLDIGLLDFNEIRLA